ncbi:MAG: cyclopropane fatty acyl phospholipid synthase [Anaerolineae bacterium]|nr:cyclopropane fatty acyl phospholipid synthase [Anaerolineae bacterium]
MPSSHSEKVIHELLDLADIAVNGSRPWDIQIHDPRLYDRVLRDGTLGLGEGYMDGWWDCEAIDQLVDRALRADLETKVSRNWRLILHVLRSRLLNLQAPRLAFEVGEQHYDLGNDLYQAMLDKRLNYTCGYWRDAATLDEAQEAKLELVCKKIGLEPGMRVLELGCGWGSFAKYAAERYGAQVLGVTVSKEQVALGMELCQGLPVELRLQDYREVEGTYDAVISIGIMEHVGYKNYRTYMRVVDRCLAEGGIAFVHTIGSNLSATTANPWTNKYIFPNGMLPSIAQLGKAMEGLFVMEDWHNIGPHYDKTLMAWHANFEAAWPELQRNYDERFRRMWRFYLLSSAGGFRARGTQLWQIVMTRPGTPQPDCRFS